MEHYSAVHAVIAYIEGHIKEPLNPERLSALTGYSLPHLREIFLRHRGVTLSQYLLIRRVSHVAFDALHTGKSLTDIALDYRFGSYDSFTRAFRRITGYTPSQFRKARPTMERRMLGIGIFGVAQAGKTHAGKDLALIQPSAAPSARTSSVLYGIPRVHYGAFGGVTPFPICLKACAGYLGADIDYADAIAGSGAAFRLTWNRCEWDGGNVDVIFTFDGEARNSVYQNGAEALGLESRILPRTEERTKEDIKAFLREALNEGMPVIAMGIVGPPEAGVVAGYREDGDTLLGWSVFQDYPDYNAGVRFDPCGYYATDSWYENGVDALIAVGPKKNAAPDPARTAQLAVQVLDPRTEGPFAKGLLAYDAWREALERIDFPTLGAGDDPGAVLPRLAMPLMCVSDAIDCICDGRFNAAKYFSRYADRNPLYAEAAAHFSLVHRLGMDMYRALGGWERGEKQLRALANPETRKTLCSLIGQAQQADEKALRILARLI